MKGIESQYDQRNQFTKADWGEVIAGVVTPHALKPDQYQEEIPSYDANGNIQSLKRNASANMLASDNVNISIADFRYHYKSNTNMLDKITQGDDNNDVFRSYLYDDLGQMVQETEGEDQSKYIQYDVTGKVKAVYADAGKTQPVTLFTYDDRGFRLKKVSYNDKGKLELITWYVRDASGNIMSTYEEEYGEDEDAQNEEPVVAKPVEMPVYASGRIGMYKPDFGMTFYELNDHLGNVRAVIGDDPVEEYMATMETERDDREVREDLFINRDPSPTAEYINHTPSDLKIDKQSYHFDNPNKVDRLNNRPNGELHPDPVGTGILVWVHPGDVINAEVYAKYTNFDANNNNVLAAVASFMTSSFTTAPVIDGASIFNVMNTPGFSALPAWANLNDNQPRAFLNYLYFDNNNKLLDYQFDQVSQEAEIPDTDPFNHPHERLSLENIKIEKEGYLYIYVSNQSDQNMEVYFDDLKVTHQYSNIVAGGDYYPFGLEIQDRQIQKNSYRNKYQGQFSEKDDETGWNHFQLREYDPTIGRWMSKDQARQFWSPYTGMGNNPVSGVDPDGAFKTEFGARWYAFWHGGGDIEQAMAGTNKGEWYVGKQMENSDGDIGVTYQRTFDYGNGNKSFGDHVWNHPYTRLQIPDMISLSFLNFQGVAGAGGSINFESVWILRGPEASWKPRITASPSLGVGVDVGATVGIGGYNYLGSANEIRRDFVDTTMPVGGYVSGSLAVLGLKAGLSVTVSRAGQSVLVGRSINAGLGYPTVGQGSIGVFNTYTLYDFYKR